MGILKVFKWNYSVQEWIYVLFIICYLFICWFNYLFLFYDLEILIVKLIIRDW